MQIDISFVPALATAFLLVFARIGTMVMLLPGVGEQNMPVRVRLTVALVLTGLLTPLGRIADELGRKALYTWGFIVFIVGSALCGFAPNLWTLVVARAMQALGGAEVAAVYSAAQPAPITIPTAASSSSAWRMANVAFPDFGSTRYFFMYSVIVSTKEVEGVIGYPAANRAPAANAPSQQAWSPSMKCVPVRTPRGSAFMLHLLRLRRLSVWLATVEDLRASPSP